MPRDEDSPLVYSTDRTVRQNLDLKRGQKPKRGKKKKQAPKKSDPKDGVIRVRRETSGRGGKTVTTVTGLTGDVKSIAKELKRRCGGGGAVKNGQLELQGDHVDTVLAWMNENGYKAVRAGG